MLFIGLPAKGYFLMPVWISGVHCPSFSVLRRRKYNSRDHQAFMYILLMPINFISAHIIWNSWMLLAENISQKK